MHLPVVVGMVVVYSVDGGSNTNIGWIKLDFHSFALTFKKKKTSKKIKYEQ